MTEYRIEHGKILGFEKISFPIDVRKLTKEAKNRSYPNLSNCCFEPLSQKKVCSGCGNPVDPKDCKTKLFKVGKEKVVIPSENLDLVKKSLDDDRIVVDSFRDPSELDTTYFTDVLFASKQNKKYKKEYLEYLSVLRLSNKVAVGMMVYNNRPYPVVMYPHQGNLLIRALHFAEEISEIPTVEQVEYNQQKVELLTKAMALTHNHDLDIARYVNRREMEEQRLIRDVMSGKPIPQIEKPIMESADDTAEIERLQELLSQSVKSKTAEVK